MDFDEFRRQGHRLVDWIADYHERLESERVYPAVEPGEVRSNLPETPPTHGEPFDEVFADFERVIMPGITHWQSPNWFAYFPANISPPSILGDLLSSGLGVQGMLWLTSPACTELETLVLDWTAGMLDLPAKFLGNGVIQDTASSAALCAMLAARERATGGAGNREGCDGTLTAYTSAEAHSSIEKATGIAGIGRSNLRLVETDAHHAMDAAALADAVERDTADGRSPFYCAATVGTTAINGMDPLGRIGEVCARHGMWLHVDAAMSGTAALCPEFRWIHDGIEAADSYSFNPHKWMLTNFDCSAFWVADRGALVSSLSILPDYLRNRETDAGAVIDYRDWQVPLGRRFRALKLWFVIRTYGIEGLQAMVREHVRLAQELASRIDAHPAFELVMDPPLNLVCFRLRAGEDATRALLERLNASGRIALSHALVDGRYTIRFCVGQARTAAAHVDAAWDLIQRTAADIP